MNQAATEDIIGYKPALEVNMNFVLLDVSSVWTSKPKKSYSFETESFQNAPIF